MADKPNVERELTYHVGWKKGKIHCSEQPGTGGGPQPPFFYKAKRLWRSFVEEKLWRDAPLPNDGVVRIFVYVLPAVVFAAAVWLACLLSSNG